MYDKMHPIFKHNVTQYFRISSEYGIFYDSELLFSEFKLTYIVNSKAP